MKPIVPTVRALGLLSGAWLIYSAVDGTRQLFAFAADGLSQSFDPGAIAFHSFAPSVLLGVMLLLPWSRIRAPAVWFFAFALLVAGSAAYLWRILSPFTTVWRPVVLLDQGILGVLLAMTAFLIVQLVTIAFIRYSFVTSQKPTPLSP